MGKGHLLAVGILGSALLAAGPAFAQHGGGHGGGGHAGGGHASTGHVGGGAHFAAPSHFSGSRSYAGGTRSYGSYGGAYHGGTYAGRAVYGGYRGGYGGYGGYHGYSTGAYWGGGYWHGGYWPRAYYGLGYAWFLPVLPLAYATYWYGGVPYYYANDVYYTWNPSYEGYTATDPPPVADPSGAGAAAAPEAPGPGADNAGSPYPGAPQTAGAPQPADPAANGQQPRIFMYPKNGQSEQQQSIDKRECQQWAAQQAGQGAANAPDYQRALVACVEGRGYSAN
ncbi:MAG: hypothetical protein ACLQAR_12280 [Steroidobacteraceae bacterium]